MAGPKLEILAQAILLRLYQLAHKRDEDADSSEVPALFELPITRKQTDLALEVLEEKGFCHVSRSAYDSSVSINKSGYLEVERSLEDPTSFIHAYNNNGDQWLLETRGIAPSKSPDDRLDEITSDIPASDRVVRLNDNQEAFDLFKTNLSELIQALKSPDQATNISKEEVLLLRGQLEAAQRMVEASPIVTLSILTTILIPPIKWLADRAVAGIIGNNASAILAYLVGLIS